MSKKSDMHEELKSRFDSMDPGGWYVREDGEVDYKDTRQLNNSTTMKTQEMTTEIVAGYATTAGDESGADTVYNHPNKLGPSSRKCITVVGEGIVDRYNTNTILIGRGENCLAKKTFQDVSIGIERSAIMDGIIGQIGYLRVRQFTWSAFIALSMEDAEEMAAQLLALINSRKNG